jgi:hypothetical protein
LTIDEIDDPKLADAGDGVLLTFHVAVKCERRIGHFD